MIAGVGGEIQSVLSLTAMQHRIPGETLSRVMAYDELGSFALIPLGTIGVGVLSASIGPSATLALGGLVALVATAAVLVAGGVGEGGTTEPAPAAAL